MNYELNNTEITASIIPKMSIGGISIGEQIADIVAKLSPHYSAERAAHCTRFNSGVITAYHDHSGIISSLSCNSNFKGAYLGMLWPGMNVADVMKNTSLQIAWCGFVQVDRIKGIGLSLPNDRDDFERLTDEFDESYVFEELWVYR